MSKNKSLEYGKSTLKGLFGAIPIFGTFINEILFEARSRIKQDRINEFVRELSEYLQSRSQIQIDFSDVDQGNIGDVFEEVLLSVSRTSARHKIEAFKKILYDQIVPNTTKVQDAQRAISITNQISEIQFRILSAFYHTSDLLLRYRSQISEMQHEKSDIIGEKILLAKEIGFMSESSEKEEVKLNYYKKRLIKLEEKTQNIEELIKRNTGALTDEANPNDHKYFNLDWQIYLLEVQDLISKGLLYDHVFDSKLIQANQYFGITKLGRWYIGTVIEN